MNEYLTQTRDSGLDKEKALEKVAALHSQAAEIAGIIKARNLPQKELRDLADEYESLRLYALANIMTTMETGDVKEADDAMIEYLRPSRQGEVNERIETSSDDEERKMLETTKKVIDEDIAVLRARAMFKDVGDSEDWVTQHTGIPRLESIIE